jgi:drug/metabolite transporter (DMT)-like permease
MAARVDFLKLIPFAIFYAAFSVAGMMLIKTAGDSGIAVAGFRLNWKVAAGLLIYFTGFCVYFYFFQKYDVSYVFPLFVGLNYVAVVLSSAFMLHESTRISATQWIGIAAVLAGILLMNIKPGGK